MISAALVIDPTTIQPGCLGPATGDIWLEAGREAFPAERWDDFIVVIADAWVRAALELFGGSSNERCTSWKGLSPWSYPLPATAGGT